jgi:alginate O-acetyltransferase complex protein AlgI
MLFNSLSFLLLFLPVALLGFYGLGLVGQKWASVWLVAASFVFYTWWTASLVFLLAGSIAFNFTCGVLLLRAEGREKLQSLLLALGIAGDLSLLIYYKYFFSLLNWLGYHGVLHLPQPYAVILPLGISFFTFTQIGYLVDCKGGVVKENRLLDYCLFVTFFPHLIAGPILHHREMMPQFANPATFRFRWENLAVGAALFSIGLAKKLLIADQLIWNINLAFDVPQGPGFLAAWDGALSFSLQLYFDFSGYSDMACGLAILFGLRFPANFNSPYRAESIIDFWQRWHMTLTRYLTLYLYNPVALWVSRRRVAQGKSVSRKAISTLEGFLSMIALPTFYTMALAGIWHGAGLTFLVFGLLHATYLTINHAWRSFGRRVADQVLHPVHAALITCGKIALTYVAVVVAEVVFRATTVHHALNFLGGMAGLHGRNGYEGGKTHFLLLAAAFAMVWTMPNSLQILDRFTPTLTKIKLDSLIVFQWKPNLAWAVIFALLAATAFMYVTGTTEFLYFRF